MAIDVLPEVTHHVEQRPDFGPTQVRSLEELESGKDYILHSRIEDLDDPDYWANVIRHVKFVGILRSTKDMMSDVILVMTSPFTQKTGYSACLFGLTDEGHGLWSQHGWMEDPSKV